MGYRVSSDSAGHEYGLQQLAELWGTGELGPRSLVTNTETGEQLYLDQVVVQPIYRADPISPDDKKKSNRGWLVAFCALVGICSVLIIAGWQSFKAQNKEVEMLTIDAQGTLVHNHKIMMKYVEVSKKFPPHFFDFSSTNKIQIDGKGYLQSSPKGSQISANESISAKKLTEIKDPSRTVLFHAYSAGIISRHLVITVDGSVYDLTSSTDPYSFNGQLVPADLKPLKPLR